MPTQWTSRAASLVSGSILDLRYGLRVMRRNWIVMGIALLSLAVAIGANTAIFTLLNALVLQHLPVPESRQLVQVVSFHDGRQSDVFSVPAVQALQEAPADLAGLFGVSSAEPLPAGPPAGVERAPAVWVSGRHTLLDRLGGSEIAFPPNWFRSGDAATC